MARITGPLFSASSSGTLGGLLTYGKYKRAAVCRANRFEKDNIFSCSQKVYISQTVKQISVRDTFRRAISEWNLLTDDEKNVYKNLAKGVKNTAVGLFIQEKIILYHDLAAYKIAWLYGIGHGIFNFFFAAKSGTGLLLAISME
jgi:hypothetical protein